MESWSDVSGGKGSVANDTISQSDSSSRSKNSLMGWELNTPCSFGHNMLVSHQEATETPGFGDFSIQELVGKRLPHNNSIKNAFSSKNHVMNPIMPTPNTSFVEDELTSSISCSAVDSNSSHDSSLFDLNLGRFADQRDGHSSKLSHGAPILLSPNPKSSMPPKRVRLAGISSHTAHCLVYGCNKDLTSSKDYHKRHKVCEVHSKTAKVIVNGVEQRFCQQCSRFHLLGEFDDGKRSCRKRLAGHNERRRKPQVGIQSGRTAKLLQSHEGCTFQGTTLAMSSFICENILPSGIFHPEKCGTNDRCKPIKVEDRTDYNPLSATSITNGNLHCKSFSPYYDFQKVFPSFHGHEANTGTESIFSVTSARTPHDLRGLNSGSSPLYQDISLGIEDYNAFDTASTVQGLSGISESGCALSLLSPKSQNFSGPLAGIPVARPLVITGRNTHYNASPVAETLIGVTSQVSNKFSLSGNNSVEGSNIGSILMSDSSDAANFDISNGFYRGSDFVNSKVRLSSEDGATIDLLQLSSPLQRVEHQRQSMQVKDENDSFCCLRIT